MNEMYKYLFIALTSVVAFWILSVVLRTILLTVNPALKENITRKVQLRDVGTWIGLCEFVLILIFVFLDEYTTIAIVFAAKEIVRADKIKEDASYYLLGTLLNVTLSLLSAFIIRQAAWAFFP